MIEVLRTHDPVRLDFAVMILRQSGCHPFVADRFMASTEGGISALQRRIMVPDEFAAEAKQVLQQLDAPGSAVGGIDAHMDRDADDPGDGVER
jgi:hypothetical protein